MATASFKDDEQLLKFARSWLWSMSRFVRKNVNVVCCLTASPKDETARIIRQL